MHNKPEQVRAVVLLEAMKTWARRQSRFYYFGRRRRMYLVHRILNATVLFCEFRPSGDEKNLLRERFQMPDFSRYRIPLKEKPFSQNFSMDIRSGISSKERIRLVAERE